MTDLKLVELVRKLHDKTASGNLKWEKTAADGVFQTTLSNVIVQIEREDFGENNDHYCLSLIDSNGINLERISDGQLYHIINSMSVPATGYYPRNAKEWMSELFVHAKRQALGVEKAIDDILSEL